MKRMLINASQPEEVRVAIVDGQYLFDLDIETRGRQQKKASVFKGKITRVEPSLEAAFVDYGADRHGFLPFKEIARQYLAPVADGQSGGRGSIKDRLKEGQELVVQVDKEERGNKGAALTTFLSLAGRYLVLMPNNPRAGGISRRVEGDDRSDLREILSGLEVPSGMGLIVRTAGVGNSQDELQWDLDYLLKVWSAIEKAAGERSAPFLIFQDSDLMIRAIRDYFRNDINEILIDDSGMFEHAREFMQHVMPHNLSRVKQYDDVVPLFNRYQIEAQIESAFDHSVRLPSGGSIVIDHTEAMVSIDINSSRSTKGGDIEETALSTNVEAADEIARQLRLRDLGGLIVIDFIDMTPAKNQREVENRLRDALRFDRARVQVGRISRFGLLEMSRQRLRPSLGESSQYVCPRCSGRGVVRSTGSLALSILRIIEEEAMKDKTGTVVVNLPLQVATFLLNEKREVVFEIEQRQSVRVVLVPDPSMDTPHFEVQRVRDDDSSHDVHNQPSYELAGEQGVDLVSTAMPEALPAEKPAVSRVAPPAAPTANRQEEKTAETSFIKRLWKVVFGGTAEGDAAVAAPENKAQAEKVETQERAAPKPRNRDGGGHRRGRRGPNSHGDGQRRGGAQPRREATADKKPTKEASVEQDADTAKKVETTASEQDRGQRPAKNGSEAGVRRGGRSRRGRRGGRRNREGGEKPTNGSEAQKDASTEQSNGEASAGERDGNADANPRHRKETAPRGDGNSRASRSRRRPEARVDSNVSATQAPSTADAPEKPTDPQPPTVKPRATDTSPATERSPATSSDVESKPQPREETAKPSQTAVTSPQPNPNTETRSVPSPAPTTERPASKRETSPVDTAQPTAKTTPAPVGEPTPRPAAVAPALAPTITPAQEGHGVANSSPATESPSVSRDQTP